MKPINLVFQGIANRSETYDFGNRAGGCIVLPDADLPLMRQAIVLALFGAGNDSVDLTLPVQIEFKFALGEEEYTLIRRFDADEGGHVAETAVITDLAEQVVYAEGKAEVDAYVADRLGLKVNAFERLFAIDLADADAINADATVRESFIAEHLSGIATPDEVITNFADLSEKEAGLMAKIEGIDPVTRDQIQEHKLVVDSDTIRLNEIRKEMDEVQTDIKYAAEYQQNLDNYYQSTANLEKLREREPEIEGIKEREKRGRLARSIEGVVTRYDSVKAETQALRASLADQEAKIEGLQKKLTEGKAAQKSLEEKFVYHNARVEEYRNALNRIIADGAADPTTLKIGNEVQSYYADADRQIAELTERKDAVDAEVEALQREVAALRAKEQDIRNAAAYKSAVYRGAALEGLRSRIASEIEGGEKAIADLEKRLVELYENGEGVDKKVRELRATTDSLLAKIKGRHNTVHEAIDADALQKITLYLNHIMASNYSIELDAVLKKIEDVERANATYVARTEEKRAAIAEVKAHLARLEERYRLLNEKLTEYLSYNRLRDISDDIEYGSHCPVCDGFVAYKKKLPLRDTKAIESQMDAVKAEIEKDRALLVSATHDVGQLESAVTVSEQYRNALIETRDARKAVLDDILKKFGCADTAELRQKSEQAAARSNTLTRVLERYYQTEAELRQNTEALMKIKDEISYIESSTLPAERDRLDANKAALADADAAYAELEGYFNGESATSLAEKLEVVERETETTIAEREAKEERLRELTDQQEEYFRTLMLLSTRSVKVEADGVEMEYSDVVAKVIMRLMHGITAEIEKNEAEKDVAKVRLAAVRKVNAETEEAIATQKEQTIASRAAIEASEKVAEEIFNEYKESFDLLKVRSHADLEQYLESEETLDGYRDQTNQYADEVVAIREQLNIYADRVNALGDYFDAVEDNKFKLEKLRAEEQVAISALNESRVEQGSMEHRYKELVESNQHLAHLQSRLKKIEDLAPAISEGAIIAKDLAALIAERQEGIVKTVSADRYGIRMEEDGHIALINNRRNGKEVLPEKYTKEERMLIRFSAAAAYNRIVTELLGGETTPIMVLEEDACDKAQIGVLAEYARNNDLIVMPRNENAFFKAASKLS